MARTPVPGSNKSRDYRVPGYSRHAGIHDARAADGESRDSRNRDRTIRHARHAVPKENILGPLGKGLKVALTVLDFGRTTFGACCTGAAKTCLRLAIEHANTRRQFKKTLGDFDLVKKKIGRMAADVYAMEAMTAVTASLIDRGLEDYMIETAMLKGLHDGSPLGAVNDAFQIHGGSAYFNDSPLERMLRDARINQIGEGSNEVLTSFIALVGMRGPGMEFKEIYDTMFNPSRGLGKAWTAGMNRLGAAVKIPNVPVRATPARASCATRPLGLAF